MLSDDETESDPESEEDSESEPEVWYTASDAEADKPSSTQDKPANGMTVMVKMFRVELKIKAGVAKRCDAPSLAAGRAHLRLSLTRKG